MSEAEPATEHASPGRVLAAARAELKLSVADVSQQIKYGVKQIAAIESDDYAKLPGTTFVRGMIRSYAKLVQIDPVPLLADLGRRDIPAAATVDLRTKGQEPFVEGGAKSNRVYVALSVAALVAVAIVAYEWQVNPVDTGEVVTIMPKAAPSDAAATASAPAPAPAPTAAQEPAPASASASASAPAPASASAAPVARAPGAASARATLARTTARAADAAAAGATSIPLQSAQAAPVDAASDSAAAKKRIELAFDQLSWVEIKQADGKILMSQLNPAGSKRVIEGVPPFQVVIGNAANVRLKYNDAPIDLRPYFKVDVARLKLE